MNRQIDKIEAAMRYVYAHFLETGEELNDVLSSRKYLHARLRHAVRALIYLKFPATLHQVANAEKRLGLTTDHSTVWWSVQKVQHKKINARAVEEVEKLLAEFENYWMDLSKPGLQGRIRYYNELPRHVLAAIVGIAVEFGWADGDKLDGLEREFRTIRKEFVEKL